MKIELLRMDGIHRHFNGVQVLKQVNFTLHQGEIHALIGENGAGKSTLMHVITGRYPKSSGTIYFRERRVEINSMSASQKLGIHCVGQDSQIVPKLSVAENIFLLNGTKNPLLLNRAAPKTRARHYLDLVGLSHLDPRREVDSLSTSEKKLLEFARVLSSHASVILLDEITASMRPGERETMQRVIQRLRQTGITFVYITHKLEEVAALADRVTVLREGSTVLTLRRGEFDRKHLVGLMTGNTRSAIQPYTPRNVQAPFLEAQNLTTATERIRNISFQVHPGEIVAFSGEGVRELAKCFCGASHIRSGQIYIDGKAASLSSPAVAARHKICFLPSDRRKHGLLTDFNVAQNISLSALKRLGKWGFIRRRLEHFMADEFITRFQIDASPGRKVHTLSRGSQQKVLLSRCLAAKPRLLILINPTGGVDIATRTQIHDTLRQLAENGVTIFLCTTELEEIYSCASRLLVLKDGSIHKDLRCGDLTMEDLSGVQDSPL